MSDMAEIRALGKAIQAANESNKISEITTLLSQLTKFTASEEILRKTEIGLCVGKLRTHAEPAVAQAAKGLVSKWKQDVISSSKLKPKTVAAAAANAAKATTAVPRPTAVSTKGEVTPSLGPTPASTPTTATAATPTLDTKPSPPAKREPRTVATDNISLKSTGDKARDKCAEMLYAALATDSGVDGDQLYKRALAIESFIFASNGAVNADYKTKLRSLYLNLKEKANPGLREAVASGELSIQRFCTMSKQDMVSEERKAQDSKIREENLFKARGAGPQAAETDMFRCGRCKSRKCTYYQMQTRSADEPMTTFVTCTNCENRWKFC